MGCLKLTYHENLPTLKVTYSSILEGTEPCTSFFSFNRKSSAGEYRYGFNGMEKDDEVHSTQGASYGAFYIPFDARLVRFLSVDPLFRKYSWNSTYAFTENNVIRSNENSDGSDNPEGRQTNRRVTLSIDINH